MGLVASFPGLSVFFNKKLKKNRETLKRGYGSRGPEYI